MTALTPPPTTFGAICRQKWIAFKNWADGDVNYVSPNRGCSPIGYYAYSNDIEACERLLDVGNVDLSARHVYGTTLPTWAIRRDNLALCKLLLDHGLDVNAFRHLGWKMLSWCILDKRYKLCTLLLEHGADIHDTEGACGSPLQLAIEKDDPTACDILLTHGANANAVYTYDRTPLHLAIDKGNLAICEVLLSHGADSNVERNGETPLYVALQKVFYDGKTSDLCELLLSYGANVNDVFHYGRTPLYMAMCNGKLDLCKILISHGADVNAIKNGGSLLGHAAEAVVTEPIRIPLCALLYANGARFPPGEPFLPGEPETQLPGIVEHYDTYVTAIRDVAWTRRSAAVSLHARNPYYGTCA